MIIEETDQTHINSFKSSFLVKSIRNCRLNLINKMGNNIFNENLYFPNKETN